MRCVYSCSHRNVYFLNLVVRVGIFCFSLGMYPPNRGSAAGTINHRHSGPFPANSSVEDTMEKQNDGMMSHLQSKITNLKNVSLSCDAVSL